MIDFVLFASVFVVYYGIECMIEYFIFGSTNTKYTSAIQSEQRKLLQTRRFVRELEVNLEAVSRVKLQNSYQTTTATIAASEYSQEKIYQTDYDTTSLVVYSSSVEAAYYVHLAHLGSVVALFALVFLISKWLKETDRKENHTILDESESEVFEVEWFDACAELSDSSETTDVSEVEWFDACAELSDAGEIFEECVEQLGRESSVGDTDAYEDCVEELPKESCDMHNFGLGFLVSSETSRKDGEEDVLIAFGDFTVQQTKEFMETTGFVVELPEENSDSKGADQSEEEEKEQLKEEAIDVFKTDPEISKTTNAAPLARELQAWKPTDDDVDAKLECLEKEGENSKDETIFSPEDMYRLNPDVQSTFLEDLSQYTTKLDLSSLSKEQIEFAERMANEIMKENKQRKNKQRRKKSKRNRKY